MRFVNRYKPSKESYELFVKKIMLRKLTFGGFFFLIVAFGSAILMREEHPIVAFIELLCGIIIAVLMVFAPGRAVKQLMSVDRGLENGERPDCVITFEDDIYLEEGRQDIRVNYDRITQILDLGDFGVLMLSKDNGLMFKWDGFEEGSEEEFRKFILQACPNVSEIKTR